MALAVLALLFSASLIAGAPVEQQLAWNKEKTVDASIDGWPLPKLLSRLSAETGWKVYVESGIEQPVSVKFQNASHADALKLLLSGYNYALVPEARTGSRLYVFKSSLSDATTFIAPEKGSKPKNWLANEIILTLPPGSEQDIDKLADELGAKVVGRSEALNAYRLEFSDAEAADAARETLAARDDLGVQDNYAFERPTLSSTGVQSPASLFPIDPKPVGRGEQVTVALVDTAIQPLDGKMKDFLLPSIHIKDQPESFPTDPTHATSMAQTLLNSMAFAGDAAKQADNNLGSVRLLPIDIYGNSPSTSTFEVAQGLHRAIQAEAQVINLSLGGTGESPMVEYLLEMAAKKQILVFASAGNAPTTDPTWPAASPYAIAVTAADWRGEIAPYANRGSFIDVKAPGNARISYNGQNYVSTGTSTATAFISGQAAALSANGLTAAQAAEAILKHFDVNTPPLERPPQR